MSGGIGPVGPLGCGESSGAAGGTGQEGSGRPAESGGPPVASGHGGPPPPTDHGGLLGRIFLTRVIEPGDETGGRWVRELGVDGVVRRLRQRGEPLPGVSRKRWAGLLARAERADPRRDLAVAQDAGVRFVCPGDAVFHLQSLCCSYSCCVLRGIVLWGSGACAGWGTAVHRSPLRGACCLAGRT